MPSIIMSKPASKLDPAIKKKAYAFLEKLGEDDTAPGLHIEPIVNSADPRVRTGRVDLSYRAVLIKVVQGAAVVYVFHGIWPHDEAIEVAKRTKLKWNPVNGITEIITLPPEPASPPAAPVAPQDFELTSVAEREPLPFDPEPEPPVPLLAALGVTREDLVGELGLDETLGPRPGKTSCSACWRVRSNGRDWRCWSWRPATR